MSAQPAAESQAERAFKTKAAAMVRERLYPGVSDAVFAREWRELLLAISEPAAYLHARGLKLPGGRYLAILGGVIGEIVAHGDFARSRNRPRYLRTCLQMHMKMRGEGYLEEAKLLQAKNAGPLAATLAGRLKPVAGDPEADRLTEALAAARELLLPPPRQRRC